MCCQYENAIWRTVDSCTINVEEGSDVPARRPFSPRAGRDVERRSGKLKRVSRESSNADAWILKCIKAKLSDSSSESEVA